MSCSVADLWPHQGGGALQWTINGQLMAQNGIFLLFLPCIAWLKHLGCLIPMPNDFLWPPHRTIVSTFFIGVVWPPCNGPLMAQNGLFVFFLPCLAELKHLWCLRHTPNESLLSPHRTIGSTIFTGAWGPCNGPLMAQNGIFVLFLHCLAGLSIYVVWYLCHMNPYDHLILS